MTTKIWFFNCKIFSENCLTILKCDLEQIDKIINSGIKTTLKLYLSKSIFIDVKLLELKKEKDYSKKVLEQK